MEDRPDLKFPGRMKDLHKSLFLLVIAVLLSGNLVRADTGKNPGFTAGDFTNIILIGWDGTDRDTLMNLMETGKLPNLKMVMQAGSLVKTEITTGKTETKPGWAEILTGYSSKTVGVIDNRRQYQPIPKGQTIFERLKETFKDSNFKTVFLAGKRQNLGARGPHRIWVYGPREGWDLEEFWGKLNPPPPSNEILSFTGEPYFLTKSSLNVYQNGLGTGETVVQKAQECLNRYKKSRFFMFLHFREPDEEGHLFGGYSAEYTGDILKDDRWLGMIITTLKNLGIYEKTLLYISTDHGFDIKGNRHLYEPHTFLVTNDPEVTRKTGDRKDIAPTILSRYGINLKMINPPLEGSPLND
jgi:hypothetical protein